MRLHPEVGARIAELEDKIREDATERAIIDRGYVLNTLKDNISKSSDETPVLDRDGKKTGVYKREGAVINRASELLGKELGMFVDRTIIGTLDSELEGMTGEQLRAFIRTLCNEVGLRMVDMNEAQTREWILNNASKVGLRVVDDKKPPKPPTDAPPALH